MRVGEGGEMEMGNLIVIQKEKYMLACKGKGKSRGVIWFKQRVNYASLNGHHETVFKICDSEAARILECKHKREAEHIVI